MQVPIENWEVPSTKRRKVRLRRHRHPHLPRSLSILLSLALYPPPKEINWRWLSISFHVAFRSEKWTTGLDGEREEPKTPLNQPSTEYLWHVKILGDNTKCKALDSKQSVDYSSPFKCCGYLGITWKGSVFPCAFRRLSAFSFETVIPYSSPALSPSLPTSCPPSTSKFLLLTLPHMHSRDIATVAFSVQCQKCTLSCVIDEPQQQMVDPVLSNVDHLTHAANCSVAQSRLQQSQPKDLRFFIKTPAFYLAIPIVLSVASPSSLLLLLNLFPAFSLAGPWVGYNLKFTI